jgi:sulfate transport system substrate-binding protein
MNARRALVLAFLIPVAAMLLGCGGDTSGDRIELLNVSYDPTRELWKEINASFIPRYEKESGKTLSIKQSHGGSTSQARAVIDGLEADVVTLALKSDTDAIARKELIDSDWQKKLPHDSLPYFSTIVFVVRTGNPRGIQDWPDLVKEDVRIITPSPKTSGNGKLSFLAAWGAAIVRGGSDADARAFVTDLYRRAPVLDSGARGATTTFAQKKIGDVHLTWENEAHLEVAESGGELEIIYPPVSIRAEPYVAVVDANVRPKGTEAAARAYLEFLYTDEAQEIIARHHYRPINGDILKKHPELKTIDLFPLTRFVQSWDEAQEKFFAEGAIFDQIFQQRNR